MRYRDLGKYTKRALDVCGMRTSDKAPRRSPVWDGRDLYLGHLTHESHVLHEIAHFITVPVDHQPWPNYGLGTDADTGRGDEHLHPVYYLMAGMWVEGQGTLRSVDLPKFEHEVVIAMEHILSAKEVQATLVTDRMCEVARVESRGVKGRCWEGVTDFEPLWQQIAHLRSIGLE